MSLQIWLPLTKDLRQQGLSNVTVTNNGATFNSAGKLGGCYKTSSSGYIDLGYNGNQINSSSISFGGWFKFNQSEISSAISGKTYTSSAKAATGNLIGNNSYGGISLQWNSNDIYTSGSFSSMSVQSYLRTSTNGARATSSFTLPFDTWTHIFLTYNKDENILGLWINGELKYTYTQVSFTDAVSRNLILNYGAIAGGNGPSAYIPFLVNDVRIYDHCLSSMEVKELSKGLVLHYPLNRMGFGQENLFKNSSLTDLTSSNLSTKIYYQGSYIPEITQDGLKFTWTGSIAREIDLWLDKTLKADTYYTLSFIYRNNMAIGSSFFLRKDGSLVGYWSQPTIPYSEDWSIYRCTFKIANYQSNDATTGTLLTLFYSGYTANKWIELKQNSIKLEEGSISTPWSPAPSDDLATTMGLNSTTEYDISGYCNNGTRTGTFTWTSDTPKYSVSTQFDSTSTKIQLPVMDFSGIANSYTFAWWQYNVSTGNMPWGFSNGNRLNCYHCSPLCWNTGDGSSNQFKDGNATIAPTTVQNGWHHMVVTGDGTATKLYIDGIYKGTATTYKSLTGTQIWISGWDSGTSYTFNGSKECDFRIYATALSAEDVKQLYNSNRL